MTYQRSSSIKVNTGFNAEAYWPTVVFSATTTPLKGARTSVNSVQFRQRDLRQYPRPLGNHGINAGNGGRSLFRLQQSGVEFRAGGFSAVRAGRDLLVKQSPAGLTVQDACVTTWSVLPAPSRVLPRRRRTGRCTLRLNCAPGQHDLRIQRGQPGPGVIEHRLIRARIETKQQIAFSPAGCRGWASLRSGRSLPAPRRWYRCRRRRR